MTKNCPVCGSDAIRDDVRPIGPHHGKRVCPNGHHCGWIPKPPADDGMPPGLAALVVPRSKPVSLVGTPAQVAAARSLRYGMVWAAEKAGEAGFADLLKCVNDASWFLANKGRGPGALKCWPKPDQMAPVGEGEQR